MRLYEFDPYKQREMINKLMKQAGYHKMGSGTDSLVFARDAGSVIKIIAPEHGEYGAADNTFLQWYKFCQKNKGNPHLPKFVEIQGQHHANFKLGGKVFRQIAMEKLKPLIVGSALEEAVWEILVSDIRGTPISPATKQLPWATDFYNTVKAVAAAGDAAGLSDDIDSDDNVMVRGNIPVITDPWVD
jgi:hypothetical protein